jgi:hypothetical protein
MLSRSDVPATDVSSPEIADTALVVSPQSWSEIVYTAFSPLLHGARDLLLCAEREQKYDMQS